MSQLGIRNRRNGENIFYMKHTHRPKKYMNMHLSHLIPWCMSKWHTQSTTSRVNKFSISHIEYGLKMYHIEQACNTGGACTCLCSRWSTQSSKKEKNWLKSGKRYTHKKKKEKKLAKTVNLSNGKWVSLEKRKWVL